MDELNETVIVTLSNPSNASLGGVDAHTYTITDNDGQPTIDFGNTASSGAEDISSVALTVYLSAASSQNVTVSMPSQERPLRVPITLWPMAP